MNILALLSGKLEEIFDSLEYDKKFAFFQYSDRPDIGDFQANCAMPLSKILHKPPMEIAEKIANHLKDKDVFKKVSVDYPGFINVAVSDKFLFDVVNKTVGDENCGYLVNDADKKTVVIDFGGYNIAKEPHVGHLRSTVIGESIRRVYEFWGDRVISDVHQGDWGLNMGMVICGIKAKYPNLTCFQDGFDGETIDDLAITTEDLTEIYRYANARAKEDIEFEKEIHRATKMLQDGYKPYRILWKYFTEISIAELKELAVDMLGANFDLWNGESHVHELIRLMLRNLIQSGVVTISEGAKVIDLTDVDDSLPPLIMEKSDGAVMYASSDMATILDRIQKYNADLILYVVDARQSLHFKQVFSACRKINLLNEKHKAEHCPFGTVNGSDGKPLKTRSGEIIKLRDLIDETIEKIEKKSKNSDKYTIRKIAVACIKFADLINYRESNYVFDFDQFTNYEGKTGAYILYSIVRINSILSKQEKFDYKITEINTKEEKDLIMELTKFNNVITSSHNKKAPNFIAEYVYILAKKFSTFYANCNINNETSEIYKKSKVSLIFITKQYIEKCLYLLGIDTVIKM